jgi:RNA-directed DNA polymerase
VRKYSNDKLIIKPSRSAIKGLRAKLQAILRDHRGKEAWTMIERLNRAIKGWAQFHRHACSSRTFRSIDERFFWEIKRWLHYRHPDKGLRWMRRKYYRRHRGVSWSFFARRKGSDGRYEYRDLTKASWIPISRHVKIRAEANPYDPEYGEYFSRRKTRK